MSDAADFTIKQNDWGEREPLRATLEQLKVDPVTGLPELDAEENEQWEPIDLTGATVRILLKSQKTIEGEFRLLKTSPVTGWAAAALGADGKVEYRFEKAGEGEGTEADLAFAGTFNMEFEITGPNSAGKKGVQSVPEAGYYTLKVEADLNS